MLKVLPENIYRLIAAGEVIKRPASVVKELLENSVDAGATAITLIINDSGRTLIQVTDNGVGMTKEEALICFLSHATSKIDRVEDLEKLTTFGFRGEALASIAACAEVTLKSRKRGETIGTEIHIAASKIDSTEECACPEGCNISVRNLFYNIPARRKFLKSDLTEYRQIVSEFTKVALTRLDIEFKFISNSKEVMTLAAGHNLKQRIADINGLASIKQFLSISVNTSVVNIYGCIGAPGIAKKSQPEQFLFANGRYFRSPVFYRAIQKGYSGLVPEGMTPPYYIYLELDPSETDVNISPDKTEIKFENESIIFQILEACVKEAVGKSAFAPAIEFDTEGVPPGIATADSFNMSESEREEFLRGNYREPKVNYDPLFNPFEEELKQRRAGTHESSYDLCDSGVGGDPIIVIDKNTFATIADEGGLTIVDISRAKEKIFYEKYLLMLKGGAPAIQEELFPQTMDLSPANYNTLISNAEKIREIGFEIQPFGKDCIVVSGTPAIFVGEKFSLEECLTELAHLLEAEGNQKGVAKFDDELLCKIAKKVTLHTNFLPQSVISSAEAGAILSSLKECTNHTLCPTGGYTLITIGAEEIKKRLL